MRINFILLKAINSVKINIYKNIISKSGGENLKNQVELIDKIMSKIDFTELNNHNFSKIYTPASKFMFYKTRVLVEFNKEKAKIKLFDIKPKTFDKYWQK